ncbi:hypothetical protein GCM10009006_01550 [Haloarcula argentinensis]|uniref:Polysaccharide biosynthesis protein C-terminal domain-containing protein n=2 Tax=Haloarcula argentinensis TaxID=43776 RepID=A0A830FRM6_HALAR|nr:hypothetical protein GCM10009006_01550 [Haloarcula argentinensis]
MIKAINKPRVEMLSGLIGLVSNFVLNLIFVPKFGISGAAFATVGGYAIYNFTEISVIYATTGITPFSVSILKPILTTIVVVPIFSLFYVSGNDLANILFTGTLATIVMISAMIFTNSVDEQDMVVVDAVENKTGLELELFKRLLRRGF